jgi:hemerythrin-like domain-containing protein
MPELCQSLINEHEVIERVLDAIEKEAAKVDGGAVVDSNFFADAIVFVREFADGVHHRKEEDILFPRMVSAGLPKDGGPIGVMLMEHDIGRAHIRGMSEALGQAAEGDSTARQTVVREAQGYVALLRGHIQKENTILFPMADQIFDSEAKEVIRAAFAEAEAKDAEVTEKRRRWAKSLD